MVEHEIIADDGKVFRLGLGDQHAIEGVAMRSGEKACARSVGRGDRQRFE